MMKERLIQSVEITSKGDNYVQLHQVVNNKRPTSVVLLIFLLVVCGAWSVYQFQFEHLPVPLSLEQAGKTGFSENEAMKHVKALTQFGPHSVGSDTLDRALQYVLEASEAIKEYVLEASESIKEEAYGEVDVEVDLFHVKSGENSGMDGLFAGKTLAYSDLNHVVLRISPKNASEAKDSAILVSAHVDTVFSAEGAGDDSSSVAVMLELARGISQEAHGFKNSVIFLFNTGEEEGLNGAHSFITQHPWRDTIKLAIDLEAMGIGGKSGIFQAGPNPWAIENFAAVAKYPSGNIVAQDLFGSGVINSATDFQVYKEVAGLSGLDFAFADNTAVYHTKNDKLSLLKPGSLQHLGENMLGFLLQAASADLPKSSLEESGGTSGEETATYFDILGIYMIVFSQRFAIMLYNSVIMLSLLILAVSLLIGGYSAVVSLALSCLSVILMWMFSISFSAAVVFILPLISSSPVPFVSSPWLVVCLFGAPALLGAFAGQHLGYLLLQTHLANTFSRKKQNLSWTKKGNLSFCVQDDLAKLDAERWLFKAGLLQWLILLVIGNYFKIGSSYFAAIWLVFPAFAYCLLEANSSPAQLPRPLKTSTLLVGLFIPFVVSSGNLIRLAATLIGNAVRFDSNPGAAAEWLVSLIVAVYVAAVICLTMVYLLSYTHNSGAKVPIIVVTSLLFSLSLCLVSVGVVPPFTEDTVRAVNIVHVVDATGTYGEGREPISYISLFSTTPGDLNKEVKKMEEEFVCSRDNPIDFVTFSVNYGCWMDKGAEIGWHISEIPVLNVESDIKGDDRITQVSIDTKGSIRWALGINFEVIENLKFEGTIDDDDSKELFPVGGKTGTDGWHIFQFSGGRKSPTTFILTLYWARNHTQGTYLEDGKEKHVLLKLRTDLDQVSPPIDSLLQKLPPWCGLFGKSTSPHTFSFLTGLSVRV